MNKEERKEYDKKYRESHKEERKEYDKQYYQLNKEYKKEYQKEYDKRYRESHKEKIAKYKKQYRKSQPGYGSSKTNKESSQYLGVTIAERVLSKIFKNIEVMPINNSGYDFICNSGYKIDVKSATKMKNQNTWLFHIRQNQIPDYFLCLAFDNRKNLNPEHIWLIPAEKVNHLISLGISVSKLDKWSQYELTDKLNDIIACCDVLRGDNNE